MKTLITMSEYKQEMIDSLISLLKIESVKSEPEPNRPYGKGLFDAIMFMMSTAEDMDLDCFNLFGQLGYIDYGEGDEIVAVLTHIDVVPAGEGWTYPPFDGTIVDGKIYGRGAVDNKGPAIASLFAIKALSDNGIQLDKKVRLIFGCDEESGWSDIEYYKANKTAPVAAFSPDACYPIINAEKGMMQLSLTKSIDETMTNGVIVKSFESGDRPNVVPNFAKCTVSADIDLIKKSAAIYNEDCEYKIEVTKLDDDVFITSNGLSAHGSMPQDGFNAAVNLLMFLNTLPLSGGSIIASIEQIAGKIGYNYNGQNTSLELKDDISGKLTLNLGKVIIDDNKIEYVIDIRYPIAYEKDDMLKKIDENFASFFDVKLLHDLPTHYVSEDSELITKLKEAYTEVTGDEAYCLSIGGATYARAFENAVSFGATFPDEEHVEHKPDENINIDSLMKCAQITANAIIKLASDDEDE
jgi:succinyl-diaminopimelate desuccinylase